MIRTCTLELVFICSHNDSSVYALNAEDGSLLWKNETHGPGTDGCNNPAPIIVDADGNGMREVIVPSYCNPTTYCFDAAIRAAIRGDRICMSDLRKACEEEQRGTFDPKSMR